MAEQLRFQFPDALAELFLDERGPFRPRQHKGRLEELLPLFVEFCSRLPRAWIRYEPNHPYGIVSKVIGHCDCPPGNCKTQCQHYDERPHALLTITKNGDSEVLLGGSTGFGHGGGI